MTSADALISPGSAAAPLVAHRPVVGHGNTRHQHFPRGERPIELTSHQQALGGQRRGGQERHRQRHLHDGQGAADGAESHTRRGARAVLQHRMRRHTGRFERRQHTGHDGGPEGGHDREEDRREAEVPLNPEGHPLDGPEARDPIKGELRDDDADRRPGGGQQQRLDRELRDESATAGTERATHRDLSGTHQGPREQQVGHTPARHHQNQHEEDADPEEEHLVPRLVHHPNIWHDRRQPIAQVEVLGTRRRVAPAQGLELGPGLLDRHAVGQTP